jgi:hypothetical protein
MAQSWKYSETFRRIMVDLVERLLERARIRRQIPTRKSVLLGERDRLSDLLEEAAEVINELKIKIDWINTQVVLNK